MAAKAKSGANNSLSLADLKYNVRKVLKKFPEGIVAASFWNEYARIHGVTPDPKPFKVTKRSQLLDLCSSEFERRGLGNTAVLHLKPIKTDDQSLKSSASERKSKTQPRQSVPADTEIGGAISQLNLNKAEMNPNSNNSSSFYDNYYSNTSAGNADRLDVDMRQQKGASGGKSQTSVFTNTAYASSNSSNASAVDAPDRKIGFSSYGFPLQRPSYGFGFPLRPPAPVVLNYGMPVTNRPVSMSQNMSQLANISTRDSSLASREQARSRDCSLTRINQESSVASSNTVGGSWSGTKMPSQPHASVSNAPPSGSVKKFNVTRQQVNSAAEDCIERLAATKEYVSLQRIENLLLQHFEANSLRELNLRYIDELPCVNEHSRLECKVNTYIQNFIKARTICTVYELHENMREFAKEKADFESLKLGPLPKLPIIYDLFKFPPDAEICELTTSDVIDDLRQFLTDNNAWTAQLNLEELLKFMMEKRNLDSPYALGLRIKSPPLAMQMLKKAQRDCGQAIRATSAALSLDVERELATAFKNFQMSVLRKEVNICSVRQEYLTMDPRELLRLVFTKLRHLWQTVFNLQISWDPVRGGLSSADKKKMNRTLDFLNNFSTQLGSDTLLQRLFQVAICCSQEQIHSFEFMQGKRLGDKSTNSDSDDDDSVEANLPSIGDVVGAIKKYLDRVVAHSTVTVDILSKIEQKILTDFSLRSFTLLKQGSYLEFILRTEEVKRVLEEYGGSLMGSTHSNAVESGYHASKEDLVEFVHQCATKESAAIETAICHHFACKEVKSLGHGVVSTLLKDVERKKQQSSSNSAIFFSSALVAKQLSSVYGQNRAVGVLGNTLNREKALACLQTCPLLCDLAEWSHWELVFKPQLKDLKNFVQKHGSVYQCSIQDGARQALVTTDIAALEVRPGVLLRLTTKTSQEIFEVVAKSGDARATSGHLISLIAVHHGIEATPLALLSNHVQTALITMHAKDTEFHEDFDESRSQRAVQFVLECITMIPLVIGHAIINKVFLEPLNKTVGQTRSKQLLLQHAVTDEQVTRLQALGMLLGIQEWTDSFRVRSVFPQDCIEPVAMDMVPANDPICLSDAESDESSDLEIILSDDDVDDPVEISGKSEKTVEAVDEPKLVKEENVMSVKLESSLKLSGGVPSADDIPGRVSEQVESRDESKAEPNAEPVVGDDDDVMVEINDDDVVGVGEVDTLSPCQKFIEMLRKDEFGVNVELDETGRRLMDKQQQRLGRSLERLAADLYSKDTHFVLELIQNADDNEYDNSMLGKEAERIPALLFVIDQGCIRVFNNEIGFQEKNIRAICDVGKTTKGKHKFGYIGQKGIGFKSVFRVTDCPEIHSKGFHIHFDVNSGPLGYILPHWIADETRWESDEAESWMTCIKLPLKTDMKQRSATATLAARFRDIQPSLLLFLHRLRSIKVVNHVQSYEVEMTRRDLSDNIIEIAHANGCDRWLVVRKVLDASKISLQAKSGVEIESTELALAFPLLPKSNLTARVLPPKQPVFAFLPLRSYGFRFVVQADFDVPSSREEVDRDSMWNQWLRSEIASVFVSALDAFKGQANLNAVEVITSFLQFVPLEDEILDFFRPVAANIFQQLRGMPCLPTQGFQWKLPSQLVVSSDPLVRDVIPSATLLKCLNYDYLHHSVATLLTSQMMTCLGVQTLSTQHLLEVGKTIVSKLSTSDDDDAMVNEVELITVSKWMQCVHKSMDEFGHNDEALDCLRSMRMIPLTNGLVTSINSDTVFFPLSLYGEKRGAIALIESDLRTVHPLLLSNNNGNAANIPVHRLLEQLGVKKLTPRDVINHHILPILQSEEWKKKPDRLLVAFMIYLMENQTCFDVNELRPISVIKTNHGFVRPAENPVHFSKQYLNQVDLSQILPGFDWTLIDPCYLAEVRLNSQIQDWRKFLSSLGVLDSLAVKQKTVNLKRSELKTSIWSSCCESWPVADEYNVTDYQCEEFASLVRLNTHPDTMVQQMPLLFQLLDQEWDRNFVHYAVARVLDKDGRLLCDCYSSFSFLLKTLPWIPADNGRGVVGLQPGSELFIKSPLTSSLLAHHVPYLVGSGSGASRSNFCSHLGIRCGVDASFVAGQLKAWCARKDGSTLATKFTTSLQHMRAVYEYLHGNLTPNQFEELVASNPVIFYVEQSGRYPDEVVEGVFLMANEAIWLDSSGLFDKYRESVADASPSTSGTLCRLALQPIYPDKERFFCDYMHVQRRPNIDEFFQLLMHITSSCTVSKALMDVLAIYTFIGRKLSICEEGVRSVVRKYQEQMKNEKVIPTKGGVWTDLDSKPMLPDDKKLEKLFSENQEVFFVDIGEKIGVTGSHKKSINKEIQAVDVQMVLLFLSEFGVRRLTESLTITSQTENYRPCPPLQSYVRKIVPWIQMQLYTDEFREIYDHLVAHDIKARLAAMTFGQVGKLELVHSLKYLPDVRPVVFNENCRIVSDSEFYVQFEHVESYNDINRELARYFSCVGTPGLPQTFSSQAENCARELKLLLGDVQPLLFTSSPELEKLMQLHNIDRLPDSEERWEVREPVIPKAIPRPVAAVAQHELDAEEVCDLPMDVSSSVEESSSGLKSWPPKSHEHFGNTAVQGAKAFTSTMWPPPAPSQQRRDHSELPANLRPSTLPRFRDGNQVDGDRAGPDGDKPKTDESSRRKHDGEERTGSQISGTTSTQPTHTRPISDCNKPVVDKKPENMELTAAADSNPQEPSDVAEATAVQTMQPSDVPVITDTPINNGDNDRNKNSVVEGAVSSSTSSIASEAHEPLPCNDYEEPMVFEFTVTGQLKEEVAIRAGRKRARVGSETNLQDVVKHSFIKHPVTFYGPPVWLSEVDECVYQPLGDGQTLNLPTEVNVSEDSDTQIIGLWGEMLVKNFLEQLKSNADSGLVEIKWTNEDSEKGMPYDFELRYVDNSVTYVEVKSTRSNSKACFGISIHQVLFARDAGPNYHLYRVYCAGDPLNVRLARIDNLAQRLVSKQLQLFVAM